MDANEIEKIEIELILEAIYQRHGYDFRHYTRASVRRRIGRVLKRAGLVNMSELIPKLLYDEHFYHELVYEFSITVTEMFRDPNFYRSVRENVFPYLRTYPFIKLWHAGCATGEEVYSMAILLQEEALYQRATVFATDFNDTALQKAKAGIYPLKDMRHYTSNYQKSGGHFSFSDYYHAHYELARLKSDLQENLTFANHNLVTDAVFSEVHLVFCRNVLIYFDQELQNQVLRLLCNSLHHGGFLCLGSKESLRFSDVEDQFKVIDAKNRIYQKQAV